MFVYCQNMVLNSRLQLLHQLYIRQNKHSGVEDCLSVVPDRILCMEFLAAELSFLIQRGVILWFYINLSYDQKLNSMAIITRGPTFVLAYDKRNGRVRIRSLLVLERKYCLFACYLLSNTSRRVLFITFSKSATLCLWVARRYMKRRHVSLISCIVGSNASTLCPSFLSISSIIIFPILSMSSMLMTNSFSMNLTVSVRTVIRLFETKYFSFNNLRSSSFLSSMRSHPSILTRTQLAERCHLPINREVLSCVSTWAMVNDICLVIMEGMIPLNSNVVERR